MRSIQQALNAAGANPPLDEDGLFGPKTQAALRRFQEQQGIGGDGVVGQQTLGRLRPFMSGEATGDDYARTRRSSPRAPHRDAAAPGGTRPARELAQADETRRNVERRQRSNPDAESRPPNPRADTRNDRSPNNRTPSDGAPRTPDNTTNAPAPANGANAQAPANGADAPGPNANNNAPAPANGANAADPTNGANAPAPTNGPTGVTPTNATNAPDAQLQQLQSRTMDSARRELEAGVREDRGRPNRSDRVDEYARNAGMRVGGKWCGYFTQFNYSEAAREAGGRWRGPLHSWQKARSFFAYRSYTDNSRATNDRLDNLQQTHEQQGSTRRFMVLEGSSGQSWAQRHDRPHEVFETNTLPIRAGDTALFNTGHVGLVESYDRDTGMLTTVEGNTGDRVQRHTHDLSDPNVRRNFEGFGRPALGDFNVPTE